MSNGGAVFLSYASQDAESALAISEALRAAGIEVWFDQSELRGGDAWDARIRRQIKDCVLFVPVISRHTQERAEGYFRLEWHLAEQRTFLMASDQPFLVPVVIDGTGDQDARVPDRFKDRQWTRLVEARDMAAFAGRVRKLLGGEPAEPRGQDRPLAKSEARRPGRRFLASAVLLAAFVCALAGSLLWLRGRRQGRQKADLAVSANAQVNDLLARADAARKTAGGTAPSREALDTAGALLAQAKSLDPLNGEVWALEAINELGYLASFVDNSEDRRARIVADVDRALALSPASFDARLAHALELFYIVKADSSLPVAEAELKKLHAERPGDIAVMQDLGLVYRGENRPKEAAATLMEAGLPAQAAWEYLHAGDWKAMDQAADQALKQDPLNIDPKLQVQLYGYEDLNAARRVLDTLPPQQMVRDYPLSMELNGRFMLREPQKMLDIAGSFPREWISSWYYLEPKALWEGYAYSMLGKKEAADAKWRIALKEIQERLASAPDNSHLVLLLSDAESALRNNEAAAASIRLFDQLRAAPDFESYGDDDLRWIAVRLRLGEKEEALKRVESLLRSPGLDSWSFHGHVRFRPDLDALRDDPGFQKIMRETKPDVARSLD